MKPYRNSIAVFVIALALPLGAQADAWSCRQADNVREVHVERMSPEPVPCQVVYRKLTEGAEDQVLWNAQHEENYCITQAAAFIEKLESWGWTCVETIRDETVADG